jgi:hypothetical protein
MLKHITIKTIASTLSNLVCENYADDKYLNMGLETCIGGMLFTIKGNVNGLISVVVSVFATQLISDLIFSEVKNIVNDVHNRMKQKEIMPTSENIRKWIQDEITKKTNIILLTLKIVTVGCGLDPTIDIKTSNHTLNNNNINVCHLPY